MWTDEAGFGLTGGCAVVGVAALVTAGLFAPGDLAGRAVAMAVVVGVLAAFIRDTRAWIGVTAVAALVFVGFLAHRYGVLTGNATAWPYTVPIVLAALLGRGRRRLRRSAMP